MVSTQAQSDMFEAFKFNVGNLVRVFEYYAEGDIVSNSFIGVILDRDLFSMSAGSKNETLHTKFYTVLKGEDTIIKAEEYALELIDG